MECGRKRQNEAAAQQYVERALDGHKVTEEEYAIISIREHKGILQALEQHNEALARQRMREHIIRSMENMLTRYVGEPSA